MTTKIALIGNVDSGKSTLVSVLVNGNLDDGKGTARQAVFVHPHEKKTGRTSAISMKFGDFQDQTVCFIDLCGHEKYLKTTLFGLNLVKPDCCFLMVGGNMGVSRMTLQHFMTVAALGFKVVVLITKVDICPDHILKETVEQVRAMAKKASRKSLEIHDTLPQETFLPLSNTIVPYLKVSNVSGLGIDYLRKLLSKIPPTLVPVALPASGEKSLENPESPESLVGPKAPKSPKSPVEFLIDNVYQVKGVGVVISGFVQDGCVETNGTFLLCLPHQNKKVEVQVKSIRDVYDKPCDVLPRGQHGTILIKDRLKSIKKSDIRRGNVMVSAGRGRLFREFIALIYIFHHQTTLRQKTGKRAGYQCIINCNGIRQSAEFLETNKKDGYLRSQDRCRAKFRFLYHEEYMKRGSLFSFREGSTIGVGKVIQTI